MGRKTLKEATKETPFSRHPIYGWTTDCFLLGPETSQTAPKRRVELF